MYLHHTGAQSSASPTSLAPLGSTMKPIQSKISSVKSVFPGVVRLSQEGSGAPVTMKLKLQCPIFFARVCCDQVESRGSKPLNPNPTPHQGQLQRESELPVTGGVTCHWETGYVATLSFWGYRCQILYPSASRLTELQGRQLMPRSALSPRALAVKGCVCGGVGADSLLLGLAAHQKLEQLMLGPFSPIPPCLQSL